MSDYPMLISNKLHSFRNFTLQRYYKFSYYSNPYYEKAYCQVRFNIWVQKSPRCVTHQGLKEFILITL